MSYILDALKKAEQKRNRPARVPTLATVHRVPGASGRSFWPWIAAGALALAVGAAAWSMAPPRVATIATQSPSDARVATPPVPQAPPAVAQPPASPGGPAANPAARPMEAP